MFKRFIKGIIAAAAAVSFSASTVFAAESASIMQYYSNENGITVYTSENISENASVRIAGVSCEARNIGDIYYNAEKYETVFLIDSSKSMRSFSDEINSFLSEYVDKKRSNEYCSIGVFSSENTPQYIIGNESDRYALEKCLDKISYEFDSTYIYDNLVNTIENLYSDEEPVFRRIVLITDGNENSARGITIDDVISEIENDPVPIYTVTLQTSSKNNIENLKNISRLARKTNAEDMRITDGGNAAESAAVLADSAQKICCIDVVPNSSLLDGSIKTIEISDGSCTITGDIRLPMVNSSETSAEEMTEASETESSVSVIVTEAPEEKKPSKLNPKIIIAAAAIAVAAVCVAVIIYNISKDKKNNAHIEEPEPLSDNDDTMIISGRSGQTEILIDNDSSRYHSVILRDAADSIRTFEVQLSAEGAVIGRSADMSDIVIDYDRSVSRRHCKIFLKNGQVYIEDLSSGNRTYVNNSEVTVQTAIKNADVIKIGRTSLKVTLK